MKNVIKYSYFILTKILSGIISTIILAYVAFLYIRRYFTKEPEVITSINENINKNIKLSKNIFSSKNSNNIIDEL